jgi:hypothetical protein
MARVGRLAGALLAETRGDYYLVGGLKEPCDWPARGLESPAGELDAVAQPVVKLAPCGPVDLGGTVLEIDLEGMALTDTLARRLLIRRNGSVSERLWRLVTGADDAGEVPSDGPIAARWLGEIPDAVWDVVRDAVLRCT